ncbi:MAG: hypothetical protein ACE5H0_03680 [Bacteroidota bacterium]
MKFVSKLLQAIGIAEVMIGLVVGITQDDMWKELYLTLIGIGFFSVGWLLGRWSGKPRGPTVA